LSLFSSDNTVDRTGKNNNDFKKSPSNSLKEYKISIEKTTEIRTLIIKPQYNRDTGSMRMLRFFLYLRVISQREKFEKSKMLRMPSPFVRNKKNIKR
jgi:hypothetical protein